MYTKKIFFRSVIKNQMLNKITEHKRAQGNEYMNKLQNRMSVERFMYL